MSWLLNASAACRSLISEVQALLTSQTSCSFYFPDPYWREEGHDQVRSLLLFSYDAVLKRQMSVYCAKTTFLLPDLMLHHGALPHRDHA